MEISVVASGSNGNCCLVEDKDTSVLIDAGKSCKEIEFRLNKMDKTLDNLNGVVLSHAHIDHYAGIGAISRKYNVPLYVAKEVYDQCQDKLGRVDVKHFSLFSKFNINKLEINPIHTSHDVPSSGFVINKFGLFTDTGIVTNSMQNIISKLDGVLIESNYDIDMLINGNYPAFLKQRILADTGHLSNIHASSLINEKGVNLNWVLLGHLSANNNTPEKTKLAFESLVKKKVDYSVLSRDKESGVWSL